MGKYMKSTLAINFKNLREALKAKYEDESIRAKDLNDLTKYIHINVWHFCPERIWIKEYIIPLFEKSVEIIQQIPKKGRYREHLKPWAKTIRERIENLDRYIKGLPSDFIPAEAKKRLEKLVS